MTQPASPQLDWTGLDRRAVDKFGFTSDAVVAAARTTLTAAQEAPSVPLRRVAHGPVGPAGTG